MAQLLSPDAIDFGAWMRSTEIEVRVHKASAFLVELEAEFAERPPNARRPEMFSTKMRGVLEFRPSEITAWAGYSGHRKSTFTGQVALDLCVQRERVLLMSPEMKPQTTLARMARQAAGVARPSTTILRHFSAWTDGRLWMFDHLGRIAPEQCLAVCRYFAAELGGTQVVIDSLMMICKSEDTMDEQKQFTTDLVRIAQETGLHVHLVAHCRKPASGAEDRRPTKYDLRGSAAITDQAHNVCVIWSNKAKAAKLTANPHDEEALALPDAVVSVEKQRNGAFEGPLKLWFDEASFRFVDDRITSVQPYALIRAEP